jgi:hypothetical protein
VFWRWVEFHREALGPSGDVCVLAYRPVRFRKGEPGQSQACDGEKVGRDRLLFVPLQRLKEEESRKGA